MVASRTGARRQSVRETWWHPEQLPGVSLGGRHDGIYKICSASELCLMTSIIQVLNTTTFKNAFMFSPCSITEIKELLSGRKDG